MLEKTLSQILKNSRYTVVLSGIGMLIESGYPVIRDSDMSYEIEQKYGYSLEEMFSSAFYSTRTEQFFEFYRNEILKTAELPPGEGFYQLAEMERQGLVHAVITRRVFGLPGRAGCKNVIELHGSVQKNYCPHCGKIYPMEFVKESVKVPLCESCGTPLRPDVRLIGEMLDNVVITRAAEAVRNAEVLMVLGTNLNTQLCTHLTSYYEGNHLIVIKKEPHFSDKYADIVIHARVDDTLKRIQKELGESL